jgi:hypothetical protein
MLDSAGKVILFLIGLLAGWVMILTFKSFWTQVKRMNEAIKKIIFGAAYPLLEITERQARVTGHWTDNFVARTVFNQFEDQLVENDHAIQEMREEQERYDHSQPLPLPSLTGDFTVRTVDRSGIVLQELNSNLRRKRPANLPPVTQENCMHFWQKLKDMNYPVKICTVCGKIEREGVQITLPNCKHEWGGETLFKTEKGTFHKGQSCIVCGKFKNIPLVIKPLSELRKSKVRSLILEKDDDQNLPSV